MQAFFILRYKNQAKGAPSKQPPDSDDQSLERGSDSSLFLARLGRQGYDRTHENIMFLDLNLPVQCFPDVVGEHRYRYLSPNG